MEIGTIVGYTEKRLYTSKKTGEAYYVLDVAVEIERSTWHGKEAVSAWLRVNPDSEIYGYDWLALGVQVFLEYDRYGKIASLRPVESLK